MKIELHEITVKKLFDGYKNNDEAGVVGYGGKLDIRPPYQREFIYKDKQRDAVIDTVRKEYPLNVMYWSVRDDGKFEVIDGQQRTISICSYIDGRFSIGGLAFHNLQDDQQEQILNYRLMVYFSAGTPSERLGWFETINIAGEELTKRNAKRGVCRAMDSGCKKIFQQNRVPSVWSCEGLYERDAYPSGLPRNGD